MNSILAGLLAVGVVIFIIVAAIVATDRENSGQSGDDRRRADPVVMRKAELVKLETGN